MKNIQQIYPTICKATLLMAYDNGCVNRLNSETDLLAKLEEFLEANYQKEALVEAETVLLSMGDEGLNESLNGGDYYWEHGSAADILTEMLVNDIFDEVICKK